MTLVGHSLGKLHHGCALVDISLNLGHRWCDRHHQFRSSQDPPPRWHHHPYHHLWEPESESFPLDIIVSSKDSSPRLRLETRPLSTISIPSPRVIALTTSMCYAFSSHTANSDVVKTRDDLVPILPGRGVGYAHTEGEIHIVNSNAWVSCPGQWNSSLGFKCRSSSLECS